MHESYSHLEYKKAPFWKRVAAAAIDGFFLVLLFITVSVPVSFFSQASRNSLSVLTAVLIMAVVFMYEPILLHARGATLGKMLMHIWVVGERNLKLSLGQAMLRSIVKFFSGILSLGYLWVLIHPQRQGWHDKIADTYVIEVTGENHPVIGATPQVNSADWIVFVILLVLSIGLAGSRVLSRKAKPKTTVDTRFQEPIQQLQREGKIRVITPQPRYQYQVN